MQKTIKPLLLRLKENLDIHFTEKLYLDRKNTTHMMKRINLTGSTLRPRTVEFKSKVAGELRETVWPLLDRQKIRVYIDSVFPLEKFKDAHIRMESGNHLGKIILSLD